MTLQDAFLLFRRLVDPEFLSRQELSAAYYRLAWQYHQALNPAARQLMANIKAAHPTILRSYRWESDAPIH